MRTDAEGGLVPVTVLSGYLGAGKTTVLNRLLAGNHARRLAVLVNDFGSINLDAALITARHGDTISLQNGCICCSMGDALGDSLDRVLALDPAPDQVVVEASGVADPANIARYGQGWPGCRLDAVITVADAETIRMRAVDRFVGELVTRQLRHGDVVVLSKCDLVPRDHIDAVVSWIRDIAGNVAVIESRDGRVDPALLLDDVEAGPRERATTNGDPPLSEHAIESIVLEIAGPLERDRVETALAAWPDDIVRVKGVLSLGPSPADHHLVQRVGRRTTFEPAPAHLDPTVANRLVVMGRRPIARHSGLLASLQGE